MTLVELMIAITVSSFVVLAATGLLIAMKSGYLVQSDHAHILDNGRYAIEVVARTIRQSAYSNWDAAEGPVVAVDAIGSGIFGLDARSLRSRTAGIKGPIAKSVNGSDVLAVRFFGAGAGENGDGTMLNCAGFGVGIMNGEVATEEMRDWSVFYVAEDSTGEAELYCKYRGNDGWTSQAIARGVESFQVLYGLDTDDDGVPNQFMNANAIETLAVPDETLQTDSKEAAPARGWTSYWTKVVAVKIGLLVRGVHPGRADKSASEYDIFGRHYSDSYSQTDPGVRIRESDLRKEFRGKERQLFSTTVYLRNRYTGSPR